MPIAPLSPTSAAAAEAAAAEAASFAALSPRSQEKLLAQREVAENHARIQREKEALVQAEVDRVAAIAAARAAEAAAAQAIADEAARVAAAKAEEDEDARTAIMMDQILAARGIKRTDGVEQAEKDALQAFREAERENREAERKAAAMPAPAATLAVNPARASRRRTVNDADSIANALSKHAAAQATATTAASHPVGSGLLLPPIGGSAAAAQPSSKNQSRVPSRRVSPGGSRGPSAQVSRAPSTQGSRAHSRERHPAALGSSTLGVGDGSVGAGGSRRHVKSQSLQVHTAELMQHGLLRAPRSGTGSAAASGTSSPTALPRSSLRGSSGGVGAGGSVTAGSSPKKGAHGPSASIHGLISRHVKHSSMASTDELLRGASAARAGASIVGGAGAAGASGSGSGASNTGAAGSKGVDASRRRRNSLPHGGPLSHMKVTVSAAEEGRPSAAAAAAAAEKQQLLREFAPGFMAEVSGLEKLLAHVKLTADTPVLSKMHTPRDTPLHAQGQAHTPSTPSHFDFPNAASSAAASQQ